MYKLGLHAQYMHCCTCSHVIKNRLPDLEIQHVIWTARCQWDKIQNHLCTHLCLSARLS